MNYLTALILAAVFYSSVSHAQGIEIAVPKGWAVTEEGLVKGNNELLVGPVVDLGELTPVAYLGKFSKLATEGIELTEIGELKDGKIVVQVTREVTKDGNKARSTLFLCKGGKNKHRLLELFTDDVFALISGGKAAIGFCDQP